MNLNDLIIILILAAFAGFALHSCLRRKDGGCGGSCDGCKQCGGNCGGCGSCPCHEVKKTEEEDDAPDEDGEDAPPK